MKRRSNHENRHSRRHNKAKAAAVMMLSLAILSTAACGKEASGMTTQETVTQTTSVETVAETASAETTSYSNTEKDGHAIHADGENVSYDGISVSKTGDSEGDEADFYGTNAAIIAENGATLTIKNAKIETNGKHANAVFSYGSGSTVEISDSDIHTKGNNSGGIMTTGGGTMKATNLNVVTDGDSSAPIRSDRGGGDVYVEGGRYESNGKGSPAIYSTANINVKNAELVSNASEGIVVEGKNSVNLENVSITADNTVNNSNQSSVYKGVMLYQSMSGDAEDGEASFTMKGGSFENKNGSFLYVNNTKATIALENVSLALSGDDFLRIEKAGWGNEGANGGQVTFTATNQKMQGLTTVDEISTLNMYLKDGSTYEGAINTNGTAGAVYVEISEGSTWTLTGDSYITSLTCAADAINLNGHTLYVDGKKYTEGTAVNGSAVEAYKSATTSDNQSNMQNKPDGNGPQKPGDGNGKPDGDGKTPSQKPSGDFKPDGNHMPPEGAPAGDPPKRPEEVTESTAQ